MQRQQQQEHQIIGMTTENCQNKGMLSPPNFPIPTQQQVPPPNYCQYQHASIPQSTAFPLQQYRIQCQRQNQNPNLLFLQSSAEPRPPPPQFPQQHFPPEKHSEEIEKTDEGIQIIGVFLKFNKIFQKNIILF